MAFDEDTSNYFIWEMANLSPLVAHRLEIQDYRHHLLVDEDGPEEQLHDLVKSLLDELSTIGVDYLEDIEELMSSDLDFGQFLTLMQYFFPGKLFITLREDSTFRLGLYHMLDGSNSSDLLTEWLDYLGRYDPSVFNIIEKFRYKLSCSSTFTDYLSGLYEHLSDLHIQPILDDYKLVAVDRFLTRLKTGHEKIKDIEETAGLPASAVQDMITQIEHLCLDPDFVMKIGYWLSVKYNTLPDGLRPFYTKLSKSILTCLPLSLEYYTNRLIKIGSDNEKILGIQVTLLGWACNKYHPKRFKELSDDLKTWLVDNVLKVLLNE